MPGLGCAILTAGLQGGGAIALSGVESSLQAANLHLANNQAVGCALPAVWRRVCSPAALKPSFRPLRDNFAAFKGNGGGIWASGSRLVELTGVINFALNSAEVS